MSFCPNCSHEVYAGMNFCPGCGRNLADLVGYDRSDAKDLVKSAPVAGTSAPDKAPAVLPEVPAAEGRAVPADDKQQKTAPGLPVRGLLSLSKNPLGLSDRAFAAAPCTLWAHCAGREVFFAQRSRTKNRFDLFALFSANSAKLFPQAEQPPDFPSGGCLEILDYFLKGFRG